MNKGPLGYMHMNTHCTHLFADVWRLTFLNKNARIEHLLS